MQHQPAMAQVCVAREVFRSVAMAWASSARLLDRSTVARKLAFWNSSTPLATSNRSFVIPLAWQCMRAQVVSVRGFES
jgi:hypothetical protein